MIDLINNKTLAVLMLLSSIVSFGQNQDTSIVLETLLKEDIIDYQEEKGKVLFSTGRLNQDSKEVIQNHYIITKAMIFNHDCATLVDALKIIPGFRVSQPGSAQLGEIFSVNGMIGNINMTVMINGFPVNPGGTPGIPIGNQLPIKQAERIEVIIGPSNLYGTASKAGVINIILAEVERPVEASSGINIGANNLREINTSLSRKMGKGINLFRYSLYGSYTSKSIVPRKLDTSLFHVNDQVASNPNFRGTSDDENIPDFTGLPQSSTLIGGNISFRNFRFTTSLMTRNTHAAIGASPDKISYSDRSTMISEASNLFGLSYDIHFPNAFSIKFKGSFLHYEMDENSSYIGIDHPLSNGRNYLYSKSSSFNFEPVITYKREKLSLLFGGQFRPEIITNNQNFMQSPYNPSFYKNDTSGFYIIENSLDSTSLIGPYSKGGNQIINSTTVFTQLIYKYKNINILTGIQFQKIKDFDFLLNSNLGFNYTFSEKWYINGAFTNHSQIPNFYIQNNNFYPQVDPEQPTKIVYEKLATNLNPEKLNSVELTLSNNSSEYSRNWIRIFRQNLTNALTTEYGLSDDQLEQNYIGYRNSKSILILNGIQLSRFGSDDYLTSEMHLCFMLGQEKLNNNRILNSYRNVPGFTFQFQVSSKHLFRNLTIITVDETRKNRIVGEMGINFKFESAFTDHVSWQSNESFLHRTKRSFNLDWSNNYKFGKNLYLKLKILNILKTKNYGIHYNWLNTNTLAYTPQMGRVFSFGLKYRLN